MGDVQTPVVGGHVYCRSRHADTDVSVCVACDRMRALQDRTSPPYVVCRVDELEDAPDPRFVAWWYEHHRPGR